MKILALTILFILLFCRIKGTPRMLSKKLYLKRIQKCIDKNKASFAKNNDETNQIIKGIAIIFTWLLEIFLIVFYAILGTKLGGTYMIVLSALQAFTCLYSAFKQCNENAFSENIEDFKFYRWYFLFNVVIDYMYYPVAIWMLLR